MQLPLLGNGSVNRHELNSRTTAEGRCFLYGMCRYAIIRIGLWTELVEGWCTEAQDTLERGGKGTPAAGRRQQKTAEESRL
jgi:hypothetical protein